jgi:PAS domain S-box-containing protein
MGQQNESLGHPAIGADALRAMIVDGMLDAVIFADCDGIIRLWNRGAEVMFGFTAAEAVGAPLDLIVPDKLKQAHDGGFRRAIGSGHLKSHGEVLTTRANHKYGSRLYVDFSFGLLKDDGGKLLGVFAVGRDATARHLEKVARSVQAAGS